MTDVLAGLVAPLVAVVASWIAVERTFRTDPARVTAVMIAGFGIKVVFFGAYVAMVFTLLAPRPAPFAASFTVSFIVLYAAEAMCLRRLFANH